jgi:hypothetical protein
LIDDAAALGAPWLGRDTAHHWGKLIGAWRQAAAIDGHFSTYCCPQCTTVPHGQLVTAAIIISLSAVDDFQNAH